MIVYSSDGSNSSPTGDGPAGAAFVIDGKNPHYFPMRWGTNNRAEMYGFMQAVIYAAEFEDLIPEHNEDIVFHTDSQWVAYIVAGRLKLPYLPHYNLAQKNEYAFGNYLRTIKEFWEPTKMTLKWVRRELNREADRAANIARERAMEKYGNS